MCRTTINLWSGFRLSSSIFSQGFLRIALEEHLGPDFYPTEGLGTAVTWLARASCTPIEIAQITGHSLASVQSVLKHYLAQHREIGDRAIAKAIAWYEAGATG